MPRPPFALFLGIGVLLRGLSFPNADAVGGGLALVATLAYLSVQTLWFSRHLRQSVLRGALNAVLTFAAAFVLFIMAALLFAR